MDTPSADRRSAQRRVDRIGAFREELADLERERVLALTPEQQQAVTGYHGRLLQQFTQQFDVDVRASQRQLSLGMRIVAALGGLALCASVFLFFYRFWGALAMPVQVAVLIAAPLAGLAGMVFTARRERTLYFTALLGMVTVAAFVLDLMAMGQLFNITPSPHAFLLWGAFSVLLAYAFRQRWLLAMGLAGLVVWAGGVMVMAAGWTWTSAVDRFENYLLPAGAMVVLGLRRSADDFSPVYRLCGWLVAFGALLVVGTTGESYLPWDRDVVREVHQLVGLAAAASVIWLGVRRQWNESVNTGAAFFALFLLIRLVDWWWDWMPKYLFFLAIGGIAILLLIVFRRLRARMEAA